TPVRRRALGGVPGILAACTCAEREDAHTHDPRAQRRTRAPQPGADLLPFTARARRARRAGLAATHGARTERAGAAVRDGAPSETVDGSLDQGRGRTDYGLTGRAGARGLDRRRDGLADRS